MSEGVIIAIIGLISTLMGAVIGYFTSVKKHAIVEAKREQKQSDMFSKLFDETKAIKARLDVHNKYAEKFGDIEKSIVAIKKDIEYIRKASNEK